MNEETAKRAFDALSAGDGYVWDCLVVFKDGHFKANAIQLMQFKKVAASLKVIKRGSKAHDQHVYDLDLAKYTMKAVLEFLRFLYLSKTASLTTSLTCNQRYLAEEVWPLAVEFEIVELRDKCVKALSSDSVTVNGGNFLKLAQLGGEMNSNPLVRKCLVMFQQKFAMNAEDALKEVREGAPMFLNAVIADVNYHPPASTALASPPNTGEGFAIDPHDCDDELFEEVLSSDHFDEAIQHLSDFEIHCSDSPDRPIRCHRNILARVPHFRQMIMHDCVETRRKFVLVKKEREVVIETLRYVYTGKNTDLPHTMKDQETFLAESVIDLAQQYGLYVLKQRCHEAMLECDISHSNVLRLLGVAALYELNELKSKCLRYFFENREVLLTTDQWWSADVAILRTVLIHILPGGNNSQLPIERRFLQDPGLSHLTTRSAGTLRSSISKSREQQSSMPPMLQIRTRTQQQRFCVYYNNSVWTVDGNGCESSKIAVGVSGMWTPLVQLDHRTVMHLTGLQAKLFDVVDNSLTDCSPMQFRHRVGSACVFNGVVYVTGCLDDNDNRKCERYNRATDTWETVADFNRRRFRHALIVRNGSMFAIGGMYSGGSIERYDAVADRWEVIRESEERLGGIVRAAVINGELWVGPGGHRYYGSNTVWKVNMDADEWVELPAPDAEYVQCMFEREGKAHLIGCKPSKFSLIGYKKRSYCMYLTHSLAFDEDAGGWKEVFEISKPPVYAIPIVPGEP